MFWTLHTWRKTVPPSLCCCCCCWLTYCHIMSWKRTNMSKNLSFCCFQDKKYIKMPILFTLLRFFDENFDVITFWCCKKLLLKTQQYFELYTHEEKLCHLHSAAAAAADWLTATSWVENEQNFCVIIKRRNFARRRN